MIMEGKQVKFKKRERGLFECVIPMFGWRA
jgi:hypothetical protein